MSVPPRRRSGAGQVALVLGLALGFMLLIDSALASVFEPREFAKAEHAVRYRVLIQELRCLVCQNQNLADSDAALAADLRRQVFEMITKGADDDTIIAFMTDRYGDFVLYRPRLMASTVALWFGPIGLVAVALLVLARTLHRHRRRTADRAPLTPAERKRARELLDS